MCYDSILVGKIYSINGEVIMWWTSFFCVEVRAYMKFSFLTLFLGHKLLTCAFFYYSPCKMLPKTLMVGSSGMQLRDLWFVLNESKCWEWNKLKLSTRLNGYWFLVWILILHLNFMDHLEFWLQDFMLQRPFF